VLLATVAVALAQITLQLAGRAVLLMTRHRVLLLVTVAVALTQVALQLSVRTVLLLLLAGVAVVAVARCRRLRLVRDSSRTAILSLVCVGVAFLSDAGSALVGLILSVVRVRWSVVCVLVRHVVYNFELKGLRYSYAAYNYRIVD